MTAARSLWKNKPFIASFIAFTSSNIGDWLDLFALQLLFFYHWHSGPLVLGLVMTCYLAPNIIISQFSGSFTERFNNAKIMAVTDFFCGLLTIAILLSPHAVLALFMVLFRACFASINNPTQSVITKQLVSEELLLKASSLQSAIQQLAKTLGPLLGSLIAILLSATICLMINAISFFVSAAIYLGLSNSIKRKPSHLDQKTNYWKAGIKTIANSSLLTIAILGVSITLFFVMLTETEMVVLLHHLAPSHKNILGVVMTANGLGALLLCLALTRVKQLKNYLLLFSIAFSVMGFSYLAFSLIKVNTHIFLLPLIAFIGGLGFGLLITVCSYLLKKEVPVDKLGAVVGIGASIQSIFLALGAAFAGIATIHFGIMHVFRYVGVGVILCAAIIFVLQLKFRSSDTTLSPCSESHG